MACSAVAAWFLGVLERRDLDVAKSTGGGMAKSVHSLIFFNKEEFLLTREYGRLDLR